MIKLSRNLKENILNIKILSKKSNNTKYHLMLIHDDKVIERQVIEQDEANFELKTDGRYFVQLESIIDKSRGKLVKTLPVYYFKNLDKNKVIHFNAEEKTSLIENAVEIKKLKFQKLRHPFSDIGFIAFQDEELDIKKINSKSLDEIEYEFKEGPTIGNFTTLLLNGNEKEILSLKNEGECSFFSGTAEINGEILYGKNDYIGKFHGKLLGAKGSFTCAEIRLDQILFHTDYFGFNRFFYYVNKSKSIFIVTNSYHLLIKILKIINFKIDLNLKKINSNFWSLDHQLALQNFTRVMDINGIFQLPKEVNILFNSDGINFVQNEYGTIINHNPLNDLSEEDISNSIKNSCKEIISSLETAINSSHFNKLIVDLTGGLDSRSVYSALTRTVDRHNKIFLNSRDTPNSSDLEIACELNSLYQYPWDDLPTDKNWLDPYVSDQLHRSFYLGTYYSHHLIMALSNNQDYLSLNGACGEILARPYIARNLFGTICDNSLNKDDFVDLFVSHIANFLLTDSEYVINSFKELLKYELRKIPVENYYESIDRLYLMFRHGYHFDGGVSYLSNLAGFMPLQSKILFKLHHDLYSKMSGLEIQARLLYELNPILAKIKFEDERDDKSARIIFRQISNDNSHLDNIKIVTNHEEQLKEWNLSVDRKTKSTMYNNPKPKEWREIKNYITATNLQLIHELGFQKLKIIDSKTYNSLLYYYRANKGNFTKMRNMYNKLISIYDQVLLCNENG